MPIRAPKGFIEENDPKVALIGHPAPAWLVNYADLMTELVCFFVILYALSASLNKEVQKAAAEVNEMIDKGEMKGEVKIDKDGLKISIEDVSAVPRRMALALAAAFYGLGSGYLIFLPMGGKLRRRSEEELLVKEIVIRGVLLLQSGGTPSVVEANLKAYLEPSKRMVIKGTQAAG